MLSSAASDLQFTDYWWGECLYRLQHALADDVPHVSLCSIPRCCSNNVGAVFLSEHNLLITRMVELFGTLHSFLHQFCHCTFAMVPSRHGWSQGSSGLAHANAVAEFVLSFCHEGFHRIAWSGTSRKMASGIDVPRGRRSINPQSIVLTVFFSPLLRTFGLRLCPSFLRLNQSLPNVAGRFCCLDRTS